jgi:hypothetical protein
LQRWEVEKANEPSTSVNEKKTGLKTGHYKSAEEEPNRAPAQRNRRPFDFAHFGRLSASRTSKPPHFQKEPAGSRRYKMGKRVASKDD